MIQTILILAAIFQSLIISEEQEKPKGLEKELESSRFSSCFEGLGCLDTTEEWYHETYRPHNLEPLDRHTIRTEFNLITKNASSPNHLIFETLSLHKELLNAMNYKLELGIVILIHDFTGNGDTGWIKHIATSLLNKEVLKSNIVSVDWEAGAEPPYPQAIANARVVALEVKNFIETVMNCSSSSKRQTKGTAIHIIGHGIGAHIAGYVGKNVAIDRITGLDPTGPAFEHMPPIVRLHNDDAKYVEVLHTDAFNHRSQGALSSFGHADFYLNGAQMQPKCNQSNKYPVFTALDRNSLKEGAILPACSHKRAFKYYIEALTSEDCEFTGFGCESYKDFLNGNCMSCVSHEKSSNGSKCSTFGLNEPESCDFSKFYLNTHGEPPFCMNPYKVDIFIDKEKTKTPLKGYFELIMLDQNGIMTTAVSSNSATQTFEAGRVHSSLYYAPSPRLSNIIEARLKWIRNPNSICIVFCTTSINVNKIVVNLITSSKTSKFEETHLCPRKGKTEIETNSYAIFEKCLETNSTCKKS